MYGKDESLGLLILKLVGCVIAVLIISAASRSCSRSDRNMVVIKDGYCYDSNTHIIYIESYTGRYDTNTTYTPYYDDNGKMCKYDTATGEWVPVE